LKVQKIQLVDHFFIYLFNSVLSALQSNSPVDLNLSVYTTYMYMHTN